MHKGLPFTKSGSPSSIFYISSFTFIFFETFTLFKVIISVSLNETLTPEQLTMKDSSFGSLFNSLLFSPNYLHINSRIYNIYCSGIHKESIIISFSCFICDLDPIINPALMLISDICSFMSLIP